MASARQNLSTYDPTQIPDAKDMHIGIICSDWNSDITHALYEGCHQTLTKNGVHHDHIKTMQVPGTFELPTGARLLARSENLDAVICLGCVIKGETDHDVYINTAVSNGLVQMSLVMNGLPTVFGVLTTNDHQQALDRAGGKHGNKGIEAAVTALRMAALYREHTGRGKGITISF